MQGFQHSIRHALYPLAIVLIVNLAGCGGGAVDKTAANTGTALSCVAKHPTATTTQLIACNGELNRKVDLVMTTFMQENGITAGSIAIRKNGDLLLEQGYGYRDAAKTTALPANALFNLASTVKPITAAAVHKLAKGNSLALNDRVFCSGSNAPCWLPQSLLPEKFDSRLFDIRIQHLLDHQAGWDAELSGDASVSEAAIQQQLGLQGPPEQDEIIRVVLTQSLDFAPGTKTAYSNFSYLLLGRIIEQASKMPYVQYVHTNLLQPLGVAKADFEGLKSLIKDRNPREPNYITTIMAPSVFAPGTMVSAIDGAQRTENWVGAGSIISTANVLALFAANYRLPEGTPLAGAFNNGGHAGADPGVSTVVRQLPSGLSYAFMLNKLDDNHSDGEASYQMRLLKKIEDVIQTTGL